MKWLKNRLFLILLVAAGIVYLSVADEWQVYAAPLAEAKALYQRAVYGQPVVSDNVVIGEPEGTNTSKTDENEAGRDAEKETASGGNGTENPEGQGVTSGGDGSDGDTAAEGDSGVGAGDPEGKDPGAGGPEDEGSEATGDDGFDGDGTPAYMTVEDDYFSDALFIGDSRTVGLYEYGELEEIAAFYASTGLTVYKMFTSEIVKVPGQRQKQTIETALQENQFKKIYLMVGINEMGTGTVDTFAEKYGEVVDHLLELQPDAIIYIQGILKVTTERSNEGDYINNEGIEARNEAIAQLADNNRIFYLDANPLLCDETGGMEPSYTFDGVHLKAQYIDIWKDYLKSHAVDTDLFR